MAKYVCTVCGYIYDEAVGEPDNGIAAGTKWEDLPDDYVCPLCGVDKSHFIKEETTMAETERWVCDVCGYVYEGDLTQEPDDYVCPLCGVDKSQFTKE